MGGCVRNVASSLLIFYFLREIGYKVTKTQSESEGAGDMRRENKKV